jgi:hypothetical protein
MADLITTRPVRPDEIRSQQALPTIVYAIVNKLLAQHYDSNSRTAVITQKSIVEALERTGLTPSQIYDGDYLNFEDHYRAHGWDVEYDKPGYNETYEAFFSFTAREAT